MTPVQQPEQKTVPAAPFRIDVNIHDLLTKANGQPSPAVATRVPQVNGSGALGLPEPVYPSRTYDHLNEDAQSSYFKLNALRNAKSWASSYAKSLWHRGELRPIIAYLFSEWKCNLDCHYCWSFNNNVKGMSEEVARHSIDWLHSIGNRVLALMGGEPLLRPEFIHKITYYASKKDFFVYLPTNGRLMKPDVIDRLGDAGLASVNLAIDAVKEKSGLPKALEPIRPYFDYLVKNQHKYGYLVMLNVNICHNNLDDVLELTEIARDNGVGTDYHINEAPMLEQSHFQHLDNNETYLTPDDFPKVDAILDYLIDKQDQGYKMANPKRHLRDMKDLMRGRVKPWPCRAGQNTMIIRTDGTLAPCFPMYSATYDWGKVGEHKFDAAQLDEMKKSCNTQCLSTCNYILGHCYSAKRVLKWVLKQARNGFRGSTGSFDD